MKHFILKYWWVFNILFFICLLGLGFLFTAEPTVFESIVGFLLLVVLIGIIVSWVILLKNKNGGNACCHSLFP